MENQTSLLKSLEFDTNPNIYPPKPASFLLAETALKVVKPGNYVLDACTGSGVVGLSIIKFVPEVKVFTSDINPDAITTTKRNAYKNRVKVTVLVADLYNPFKDGMFDVITVHPPAIPYPPHKNWGMTPGMRIATNGGHDGSHLVSRSIIEAKRCLKKKGILLLLLPHWSNVKNAMSLLHDNYAEVVELDSRRVNFFPITEGSPDKDVVRYTRNLAEQGVIELDFIEGKPVSKVSVIQAIKR